jgi:parallel beta-helix repeat protein
MIGDQKKLFIITKTGEIIQRDHEMIKMNVKISPILALLVVLGAAGMAEGAATLRVCDCRACGCQYLSIQEAIDIATPGDTVLVRSGSFIGNINVTKPITLRGERWKGLGLPIINADGNGSCITVSADGVRVESIRVTDSGNESVDAGIRVLSNNVTIVNNIASGNRGAGIILEGSSNSTVLANVVSENAVGVFLYNSADNLLTNNRLFNNTVLDAFDDGKNRWDDGTVGNYYGSFNCTDEDGDEICDSVYEIPGGSSIDAQTIVG